MQFIKDNILWLFFLRKNSHLALDILTINNFHLPKAIIEREGICDRVLRHTIEKN